MDIGAIIETGVMIILGYGIMFGIIVLLMLPVLYLINLYERMKNHRFITNESLVNPFEGNTDNSFRFLNGIRKRHQKEGIKKKLYTLKKEIHEQRLSIREQSQKIRELSEVNQQLMSITIKLRQSLRD